MNNKKIIILPIKEPWASMIASGEKRFEFRSWVPKWICGQEIWIVATGKASNPRKVVAKAFYGGTYYVDDNFNVSKTEQDRYGYVDGEINDKLKGQAYSGHYTYPKQSIIKWGGWQEAFAIKLNEVELFEPFTLESIGIMRTPQKFQYYERDE